MSYNKKYVYGIIQDNFTLMHFYGIVEYENSENNEKTVADSNAVLKI
jgi:hypothetical protein